MTQAITTKVLHATDTKGTRIKASCGRGSITVSYPYGISGEENVHQYAVNELIRKFILEDDGPHFSNPWASDFVTGSTKNGYVHVFISSNQTEADFIARVDPLQLLND